MSDGDFPIIIERHTSGNQNGVGRHGKGNGSYLRIVADPSHKVHVTVKKICDIAEINRATFYKHYADPFDLIQKLEEEVIKGMQQDIENSAESSSHSLLLTIIKGMMNKENSYALLTSSNGDLGFASRISELFYQGCRLRLAQHMSGCTEAEKDAAYLFVAGGCG